MKEPLSNIDQQFKARLYDAEVPPPAFVWEGVERQLQRKKRRRFIFWLFFGLGLSGLLGWQGLSLFQRSPKTLAQTQSKPSDAIQYSAQSAPAANAAALKTTEKQAQPASTDNNSAAKIAPATSNTPQLPATKASFRSEGHNAGKPATLTPKAPVADALPPAVALKFFEHGGADVPTPPIPQTLENAQTLKHQNTLFRIPHSAFHMPPPSLLTLNAVKVKAPRPHKAPVKKCYDFSRSGMAVLFDAYAGPSFTNKELLVRDAEDLPYRNARAATESDEWAVNAGVRASLMLHRHFLIRTGLHYEQFVEEFEYFDPENTKVQVEYEIGPNGQVVGIDTIGIIYGEDYTHTYNRFGMLDIPFQAGFEVRSGRTGINLSAGGSVNILFWKRGAILATMDNPEYFTPGVNNSVAVFKQRAGISAMGSVQWFYHVKPRVRVFIEPYYRQVIQPVSIQTHLVEQRYGFWGLRLGLTKIVN
jgi:hypothetical protein